MAMVGGRTSQFARLNLHHQRRSNRCSINRSLRHTIHRHLSHGKQVDSFNAEKTTADDDESYHARIADSFRSYHSSQTPVILRGFARVGAGVDFELPDKSLTIECRNPQLPGLRCIPLLALHRLLESSGRPPCTGRRRAGLVQQRKQNPNALWGLSKLSRGK